MSKKKVAKEVVIKNKSLVCPVCEGTTFWSRETLLNTPAVTFLGFDWLNKKAINYICNNCDYIYWFYKG